MKSNFCLLAIVGLLVSSPIAAQTDIDRSSHRVDPKAMALAAPMSDGEVQKIDKSAGKVTIKHGPLHNLDMPAMTMVFRVKDPAMLDQIKEGDKIKFRSDRVHGALTVTEVQLVQEPQSSAAAGDTKQHGVHLPMSSHAPSHGPDSANEPPAAQHGGHAMGGHGMMIDQKSKLFSTIGYDDPRQPRPVQTKRGPTTLGDPVIGKRLAQSDSKGRCLNCHVLDKDGALPGDVGPNLIPILHQSELTI
jgi:Cu/Ag efflux protein CusF